ncbi:MAG: acylphosphatase [Deltaproteobacteria bacterium]|nr:acylphosphatase [Deltaproteobacteria bacterium]
MAMTRVHLVISGEVQGVYYRASAREEAVRLGVTGWVRNLPGGEVEAEVEGPDALVEEFIRWCWKGPRAATVSDVKVTRKEHQGELKGFGVLH